jgi:hypothetical protein
MTTIDDETLNKQIEKLEIAGVIHQFHYEARCKICTQDKVRAKVNELLTKGMGYAAIQRGVNNDDKLEREQDISYDSIRQHATQHYPVQNAAKAVYRDILEQRAAEAGIDYVDNIASALTPIAFLETVMTKSYQQMTMSSMPISVETGMKAAERLHAIIHEEDQNADATEAHIQLNRVIEAVRSTVPVEYWDRIVAKLKAAEDSAEEPIDVEVEEDDEMDELDAPFEGEDDLEP